MTDRTMEVSRRKRIQRAVRSPPARLIGTNVQHSAISAADARPDATVEVVVSLVSVLGE